MFPKSLRYAADDSRSGDNRKIINSIHCFFSKKSCIFAAINLHICNFIE